MNVKELAAHMGPAGGFCDSACFEDGIEACIAISVKDPFEGFEMALRMLAPRLREGRLLRSGE